MSITRVVLGTALAVGLAVPPSVVRAGGARPTPAPAGSSKRPDGAAPVAAAKKPGKSTIDLAAIAPALVGADVDAATKAVAALASDPGPAAHDALLDALATGLAPKVAAPAVRALAEHPAPADVALILVYAAHRNDDVRAAAVGALGAYPDPAAKKAAVAALGDDTEQVRAAAAAAIARGKIKEGVERLFALLDRGDAAAPPALAALADADLAHAIGEHLGTAPAGALAQTLGAILKRADFPEPARVEVVRAIAKIPGAEATSALTDYVESTPEKPPRKSRAEAEKIVEARLAGGGAQ